MPWPTLIDRSRPLARWPFEWLFGLVYWIAFLLVLEPDNALRAHDSGSVLTASHEVLRIVAAATLGASATPPLLSLTRRFPLRGAATLRHALIRLMGVTSIALVLIVASCFLAAWGFRGEWLPSHDALQEQLVGNWLLLIFALAALDTAAHLMQSRFAASLEPPATVPVQRYPTKVSVKTRGRQSFVDLGDVDWIEAQGNYVALHVGTGVHLVRSALGDFEATLDPARFLRVHRRAIVAIQRIRELQPLTNGDARLIMSNGGELRASRRYRALIGERWARGPQSMDAGSGHVPTG